MRYTNKCMYMSALGEFEKDDIILPLDNNINGHQSIKDHDLYEKQPHGQNNHGVSPHSEICTSDNTDQHIVSA